MAPLRQPLASAGAVATMVASITDENTTIIFMTGGPLRARFREHQSRATPFVPSRPLATQWQSRSRMRLIERKDSAEPAMRALPDPLEARGVALPALDVAGGAAGD